MILPVLAAQTAGSISFSGTASLDHPIVIAATNDVAITFQPGTRLIYSGNRPLRVLIEIVAQGHNVTITGNGSSIDGANRVARAIEVLNDRPSHPNVLVSGLSIKNIKMLPETRGVGASALWISGSFRNVGVNDVAMSNISRTAGTGMPGHSGTQALVYTNTGNLSACHVSFDGITGTNVTSDDPPDSHSSEDMDLIVLFQKPEPGCSASVSNVLATNVRGRVVKMFSTNDPVVDGVTISRDVPGKRDGAVEINMQGGVGTVRNITATYAGDAHRYGTTVVSFFTSQGSDEARSAAVEHVHVIDRSVGAQMDSPLQFDYNLKDQGAHDIRVKDVRIEGRPINYLMTTGSLGVFAPASIDVSGMDAQIVRSLVKSGNRAERLKVEAR